MSKIYWTITVNPKDWADFWSSPDSTLDRKLRQVKVKLKSKKKGRK